MARPTNTGTPNTREERLKAVLKANMAKRKAQARARSEDAKPIAATQSDKEDEADG